MFVSKNAKISFASNAKPKICVTPNANPQRKSVAYRLRWVPIAKFLCWPSAFHFVAVDFIRVGSRFSVEHVKVNLRGKEVMLQNL